MNLLIFLSVTIYLTAGVLGRVTTADANNALLMEHLTHLKNLIIRAQNGVKSLYQNVGSIKARSLEQNKKTPQEIGNSYVIDLIEKLKRCLGEKSMKNVEVHLVVLDVEEEVSIKGNRVNSTDTSPMGIFGNNLLKCVQRMNHIA